MIKLDLSNVIVDKTRYAGCGGAVPFDDPMFSGRATVSYGSGCQKGGEIKSRKQHPKVNVPDNPEFRKVVIEGLRNAGLDEDEISYCLEYDWDLIKSCENSIAYRGGDFDLDAKIAIDYYVHHIRKFIPHLIEKKIPFGPSWGFKKVGDHFVA